VSFGTYARQVRNPALPYTRRVSALRSCVQLYRPIGFQATLSFLAEVAGPFQRDEAALLRALDALTTSRAGWLAEVCQYAETRRRAKRLGQRTPRPTDPNPNHFLGRWYGAARPAALHALRFWRQHRLPALLVVSDQVAEDLNSCVTAALASDGPLTLAQRQLLTATIDKLQTRVRSDLWHEDQRAYFRAWSLMIVARYVETAADSI
jgi:hypothetical protein